MIIAKVALDTATSVLGMLGRRTQLRRRLIYEDI